MARQNYDPTSVAARRLQSQKKNAHRIKLRKQLEKARKKIEAASNAPTPDTLAPEIEAALDQISNDDRSSHVKATKGPYSQQRTLNKPNPLHMAIRKREERTTSWQESQEKKEQEIMEQARIKRDRTAKRERVHKKLTEKTQRGQPKFSKHIDVLLGKIQKGNN